MALILMLLAEILKMRCSKCTILAYQFTAQPNTRVIVGVAQITSASMDNLTANDAMLMRPTTP